MRNFLTGLLLAGATLAPLAAHAQTALTGRVDRLEGEMRAVQRKVFPGNSQYYEPQIRPEDDIGPRPGTPSSSAVADLDTRVNALESQLSGLTGQIETSQHKLMLVEDAFAAYKRSTDARLKALEDTAASTRPGAIDPPPIGPAPSRPAPTRPGGGSSVVTRPVATRDPVSVPGDPARARKVAAIDRPISDDPAEDAYIYAFRLWQAQLYPEAEAQFKSVVATYPHHKRASYAQNMLGRSYYDDGKPSLASIAFYDNYKKNPEGDRAPDSLYYLAQALMKLNKPVDACKVYGELSDVYATRIGDDMRAKIATGRGDAKCR